ncbi:MAG TPA: hypothetical protein VFW04_14615 [Gemmatimonadaceae bacterium]|nr:hypothetical protein [Gemmatimonadaceae bacterium]
MIKETNPPDDSFPTAETFVDCCGEPHEFALELLRTASGYFLRATECASKDDGYAFAAHSETGPYLALGRLRSKLQKGLATRYLAAGETQPRLGHDVAVGRISYGGVVVDGQSLTFDELAAILSVYEGWQFKLEIVDPYDALP